MELLSARCRVRPFQETDLDAFMDYRNDEKWMIYQGFKGLTKSAYREQLLSTEPCTAGKQLAIVDRQTDQLIGDLYLRKEGDSAWLGYTIAPAHSRKGYAYEIIQQVCPYLKTLGINQINAGVLPENIASIHLLKKLGFSHKEFDGVEHIFVRSL